MKPSQGLQHNQPSGDTKGPHPTNATDFRPISCCTIIYKVVAKPLCARLKHVLPALINQIQGAFVQGRQLLYNVLLCQKIGRGYGRKHLSPRCLMKIDPKKAFNSIYWGFVKGLLGQLQFPPHLH